MCGISGLVYLNRSGRVDLLSLKKMTDVIEHRGPDGEGFWISPDESIGFGHRRLSIIDLTVGGKQPMHYLEDRYTITFNGEIYNYIEIKSELLKNGYVFNSQSDTEVLLALYDFKKEKCLDDLDGMFAFAIWDQLEQKLFCARDRFGEKPFHYYLNTTKFIFASEIKQFWALGIEKKISAYRLNDFVTHGLIDDSKDLSSTFYSNIKKLDAAHYLTLSLNGQLKIVNYWKIDASKEKYNDTINEAAQKFFELFTESVRLRLRSDVPVGSSLSGGLDSSSIVMIIDRLKDKEVKQNTFSARFENYSKDEGKFIEEVVKNCRNIYAHYTWPDQDYFLDVMDKVHYHQDEPFGSASIVAQYAVMDLAKKNNVTVLLDGQGADEQLAGYLTYYSVYLNQLKESDKQKYLLELGAYDKYHGSTRKFIPNTSNETYRMKLGRIRRKVLGNNSYFKNQLQARLINDTCSHGLKELLRYADRNSMAHSREMRLPFLSHKLVEFVFTLPDEYKLNNGWTKFVLRKAMDKILPESICWRVDKIAYEPPQVSWMKNEMVRKRIDFASKQMGIMNDGSNTAKDWRFFIASKYI